MATEQRVEDGAVDVERDRSMARLAETKRHDGRAISKAEIRWRRGLGKRLGEPLTDSDVLEMLEVIRLWSNEQVPPQANPWLWKNYMVLAHATEPAIATLKAARTNHQED